VILSSVIEAVHTLQCMQLTWGHCWKQQYRWLTSDERNTNNRA